jgi:hypothetical protein
MRLSSFSYPGYFSAAIFLVICLNTKAQNDLTKKYVKVETDLMSLHTMLTSIQSQTNIGFCFVDDSVSNISMSFSKKLQHVRVDSLLDMFCSDAGIEYTYKHGQIVIRKKTKKVPSQAKPVVSNLNTNNQPTKVLNPLESKPVTKQAKVSATKDVIIRYDTIVKTIIDTVYRIKHDTIRLIIRDTIIKRISVPQVKYIESKWKVGIGAYAAPEFALWTKISPSDANYTPADSMKVNYKTQVSWSSGLFVNISQNRYFGAIGIAYSQVNGQIKYSEAFNSIQLHQKWETFFRSEKVYSVIEEYTEIPSGKTIQVWDSVPTQVKDSSLVSFTDTSTVYSSITKNIRYRYIDIPVSIGYTFLQTQNLGLYALAGVSAGLLFSSEGKHYSFKGKAEDTDLTHLITFRLRASGGLGVKYSISKPLTLWGDALAIFNPLSMYSEKLAYTDKQIWATVRFGFNYKL